MPADKEINACSGGMCLHSGRLGEKGHEPTLRMSPSVPSRIGFHLIVQLGGTRSETLNARLVRSGQPEWVTGRSVGEAVNEAIGLEDVRATFAVPDVVQAHRMTRTTTI